jgi:hypothetical protein
VFNDRSKTFSSQLWLDEHRTLLAVAGTVAAGALLLLGRRNGEARA